MKDAKALSAPDRGYTYLSLRVYPNRGGTATVALVRGVAGGGRTFEHRLDVAQLDTRELALKGADPLAVLQLAVDALEARRP